MLGSPRRCCDGDPPRNAEGGGPVPARRRLQPAEPAGRGGTTHLLGRPPGKAKSVILLYLLGGAATQDMFDLKPDAPAEVRGEFKPIATSAAGMQVCEHLPRMAKWMHRAAIVRSRQPQGRLPQLPAQLHRLRSAAARPAPARHRSAEHGLGLRVPATSGRRATCPITSTCPAGSAGARRSAAPAPTPASSASATTPLTTECKPYADTGRQAAAGHIRASCAASRCCPTARSAPT